MENKILEMPFFSLLLLPLPSFLVAVTVNLFVNPTPGINSRNHESDAPFSSETKNENVGPQAMPGFLHVRVYCGI